MSKGERFKGVESMEIKDGVSPKAVLKERGIHYEGAGFLPELPDYLGYVLVLLLIWIVYTGYSSVVSVFKDPQSTVAKTGNAVQTLAVKAFPKVVNQDPKSVKVESFAKDLDEKHVKAKLEGLKERDSTGWRKWLSLREINKAVSSTISNIPDFFNEVFSGESEDSVLELRGDEKKGDKGEGFDSLERF